MEVEIHLGGQAEKTLSQVGDTFLAHALNNGLVGVPFFVGHGLDVNLLFEEAKGQKRETYPKVETSPNWMSSLYLGG